MSKKKIFKTKTERGLFLGYRFSNAALLQNALAHSSYAVEWHCADNERMEYLGDAVLELCISEHLYENCPRMREGEMTKTRAKLVCEDALYRCAVAIGLPEHLLLGGGEDRTGGRGKPSILSDAMEAVIGAVFLDGGYIAARNFIRDKLLPHLISNTGEATPDYKTRFQEYAQGRLRGAKIVYDLIRVEGPDHRCVFTMRVSVNGKPMGEGSGKSKQSAGQQAAKAALLAFANAEKNGDNEQVCD